MIGIVNCNQLSNVVPLGLECLQLPNVTVSQVQKLVGPFNSMKDAAILTDLYDWWDSITWYKMNI